MIGRLTRGVKVALTIVLALLVAMTLMAFPSTSARAQDPEPVDLTAEALPDETIGDSEDSEAEPAQTEVAEVPLAADPSATATDSETTVTPTTPQEDTAPAGDTPELVEPEQPGFFRGLVQNIVQAFNDPAVTGPAEDSGWEEYLPEDPTGLGWTYVEPITDAYHENYFLFENARTQVPDQFPFSDSDLDRATALPPVEGVRLHLNTVEPEVTDIDVEWLTEDVDYLKDRGPKDGVIDSASVTVELEISVESGPERTLRIVAPAAGNSTTTPNFCVSAPEVGIVAVRRPFNSCDYQIPSGVTWTGSRTMSVPKVTDDYRAGRGVVTFLTNAGNAVSRPVSFFNHTSRDAHALNGKVDTVTGEGFFNISTATRGYVMEADLIIHAEDFPVGTRFSYEDQVVERTADASDLTLQGVRILRSYSTGVTTRIDFQIPEDYLPTGSVAEAGRYDVGFSLENATDEQGRYDGQWFLKPEAKLFHNLGDGTDYGSFEDKDTMTVQRGLSASYSQGGFVNNNWARVSWVEPVRIKGSTTKELLAPYNVSYGGLVSQYSALARSLSFTKLTSGNYNVRTAGGTRLAEATPGIYYGGPDYSQSKQVAHGMEMFSVVTYRAETYGPDAVGVGDTIAVCDVWDTYDYHYDDSRDMLVPDGVEVYYTTSPRVTQGPTPGSDTRTAQCGDYSDTSVWTTDKPEDMSSVTGVVTTLAVTEEMMEDGGDVVTLYAGAPVVVPPYREGGPVAGDKLPDWFASTAGTEFGATQVANATIVTPNAGPIVRSSHRLNPGDIKRRGETVSYIITPSLYDAHYPHLTGPLVVTDFLPRCLEGATVSEETLEYYEITAWRNKGEAVCGDDSSPQEEIELTLRPGVEVESNQTLDYHVGDRYTVTAPPIDLTATISRTAPNQSLTNYTSARYFPAEGESVVSPQASSVQRLQWVADTGLVKTVDQTVIEPGEPVTWTLSAINETSSKAGDTTFIDIFPHDGIAWDETILGETWGNDFNGELNITDVSVVYGAETGAVVSYTSHDPTLLDPDNPNQEGVDWVSDVDAIGGYGNVTAIKVFIPNFGDAGSEIVQVRVTAQPENTVAGDVLVNKLSRGHAANINLDLPDPGPVRTEVVASTVEGTLWHDQNRDAVRDEGEPGLSDTEVTLCRLDGPEAYGPQGPWTTRTDEEGRYLFDNLHSGTYVVSLAGCEATEDTEVPEGFPLSDLEGFEQTYSYQGNTFEESTVVAQLQLGIRAQQRKVDFGFHAELPVNPVVSVIKKINGEDADTEDEAAMVGSRHMEVSFEVSNAGDVALEKITLGDEIRQGHEDAAYINGLLEGATFTRTSDDEQFANGELMLEPGDRAVLTVRADSPEALVLHENLVTVEATVVGRDITVTDDDPAFAWRPESPFTLPATGGAGVAAGVVLGLLALGGAAWLLRSRRKTGSDGGSEV